jgi:protein-S-isoprenylcysteine O-methyltransferase Ste14
VSSDQVSARPRVPRPAAWAFSTTAWLVVFALLPVTVARRGRRFGWRNGRPGAVNLVGLVGIGVGAAGWASCVAAQYASRESVPMSLVPETLAASGPYGVSRNPMYVSEQVVVLGWAALFGSPRVLGGAAALAAGMRYAVSREEKTLETRFGDAWDEYAARVPRWI